jgi:ABC-2 type transport system permease protein
VVFLTAVAAAYGAILSIRAAIDAINGEFSRRTMSRVLAQPIYRDALLLGKFLAGLVALAIGLVSLWFLVIGLGLLLLGLPPSTEETICMVGFFVATLAYGGVGSRWLCCSRWCSAPRPPPPSPRSACGCCSRCSGRS